MIFTKEFLRYFSVSAIALFVDYSVYLFLIYKYSITPSTGASIGYSVGLLVAYLIMTTSVFRAGWLKERRVLEIFLFTVSGLFGVALTYFSVAIYIKIVGESLHEAKIFAMSVSFICVYLFRKFIVFR